MAQNVFSLALFSLIICSYAQLPGLSYEYLSDGYFTSIHVLTVNPYEHTIIPVKATGKKVKRETVLTLAERYRALAAVNGGFWKLDGTPAGALKINQQWLGTPNKPRGAIGWSNITHKVVIDIILTNDSLANCPLNLR